ncbi:MAG: polysaccharide biosynthesis C-terminal domain-containing protein [Methylococcus sp.]
MNPDQWRRYLTGYLPVNLVQAVVGIGSLMIYSHLMTPIQFGHYVLALSAQFLGQWLFFGGFLMATARWVPRANREGTRSGLLATVYGSCLLLVALVMILGGLIEAFTARPLHDATLIWVTVTYTLVRGFVLIGLEVHRNSLEIGRYSRLEIFQTIVGFLLGTLLVASSDGQPEAAIFGLLVSNLLIGLMDLPWLLRAFRWRDFSKKMLLRLWRYGAPMLIVSILFAGLTTVDGFLMAQLLGPEAVAHYGAAVSLADRPLMMVFVWVGVTSSSMGFNVMENRNAEAAAMVMNKAATTLVLLTWPMAVGIVVLAWPLATALLGPGIGEGVARLLPLVALMALLKGFMAHYFAQFFQLTQQPDTLAMILVVTLILNVALNVILIPVLGIEGAPISAIVSYGLGMGLSVFFARRHMRVPFVSWPEALKGLFGCLVMFLVIEEMALKPTVLGIAWGVFSGILVYFIIMGLLNPGVIRQGLIAYVGAKTHDED